MSSQSCVPVDKSVSCRGYFAECGGVSCRRPQSLHRLWEVCETVSDEGNAPDLEGMIFSRFKGWLTRLSFRTGLVVAVLCVICYVVSFAQMMLPISAAAKGMLWVVFFGAAKTFQYGALIILGSAGIVRLKAMFRRSE